MAPANLLYRLLLSVAVNVEVKILKSRCEAARLSESLSVPCALAMAMVSPCDRQIFGDD